MRSLDPDITHNHNVFGPTTPSTRRWTTPIYSAHSQLCSNQRHRHLGRSNDPDIIRTTLVFTSLSGAWTHQSLRLARRGFFPSPPVPRETTDTNGSRHVRDVSVKRAAAPWFITRRCSSVLQTEAHSDDVCPFTMSKTRTKATSAHPKHRPQQTPSQTTHARETEEG